MVILHGVGEAIRRGIDKISKVYIIIRRRGGWQEANPDIGVEARMISTKQRDDRRAAWWFLLPVLAGFAVFYGYPAARGLWYSVTDYTMLNTPSYVGMENYAKLVRDDQFWNALLVTAW
jgi:hypothetical protein